jgi:2-polyprenyl-6-methoxyphenol hydroxylase-like FAD-dependent oxidoreductase
MTQGKICFDSEMIQLPYMGYIVENELLHHSLIHQLRQYTDQHFCLLEESHLERLFHHMDEDPLIHLDIVQHKNSTQSQMTLSSDLVVGADGMNSTVRHLAGFESVGWDYKQSAIVATMTTEYNQENDVAWQRFLPTGSIAMLPVRKYIMIYDHFNRY